MSSRLLRSTTAVALTATACAALTGLDDYRLVDADAVAPLVEGGTVERGDAGVEEASSVGDGSSPSDVDARPTSTECLAFDPTATRCLFFETPPSSVAPTFGFDALGSRENLTTTLNPSPTAGGGQGLSFDIARSALIDHSGYGVLRLAGFPSRVVLDLDLEVTSGNMEYAMLAGFLFSGTSCSFATGLGLGVMKNLTHRGADPSALPVGQLTLKTPHHVRFELTPKAGTTSAERLFIDGRELAAQSNTYDPSCSSVVIRIGAWYTSSAIDDSFRASYDNIVVHTE